MTNVHISKNYSWHWNYLDTTFKPRETLADDLRHFVHKDSNSASYFIFFHINVVLFQTTEKLHLKYTEIYFVAIWLKSTFAIVE